MHLSLSLKLADGVDVYNILIHNGADSVASSILEWSSWGVPHLNLALARLHADPLTVLMNGPIKKQLGIPEKVIWGGEWIKKREGGIFGALPSIFQL